MKAALVALLFAASALAQDSSGRVAPACGPKNVSFDVKADASQHAPAQPEPGKALVYFIQEKPVGGCIGTCITRIGLDGAWAGAFAHKSWFSVSLEPGPHHLCMNPQAHFALGNLVGSASFTAEAGKVYYFGARAVSTSVALDVDLEPLDGEQAKPLIASSPLSVSHPRK
jgi:hypothetical protein